MHISIYIYLYFILECRILIISIIHKNTLCLKKSILKTMLTAKRAGGPAVSCRTNKRAMHLPGRGIRKALMEMIRMMHLVAAA